ncbi:NAD(P)-binding domain-containing protein [Rozella allomycis CSF55]|uniref:NAD(P)-binding domain-containing protein n=1 Tax=Rozella allomycis (strain CSF55) TaxID=988480 RepID=A0A075AX22_ROZAC|nr:NAD(P)-binding domain-containing protein [Rozella allomycis CSF55]|eukprot:EPZ34880.1 NAD(P)-binding domain-containing protein [Rozella allomycis CSF55]
MNTVFIQGASRGIGFSLINELIGRNIFVIASCRNIKNEKLNSLPKSHLKLIELDLLNDKHIENFGMEFSQAIQGKLMLSHVSMAGVLIPEKSMKQVSYASINESFKVNCISPFLIVKETIPFMLQTVKSPSSNLKPTCVYISAKVGSISENNQLGGWYSYRSSKAAGNMLWKTLSCELGPKGISCFSVHPGNNIFLLRFGFVDTDMTRAYHKNIPQEKVQSSSEAANRLANLILNNNSRDLNGKFFDLQNKEFILW